MRAVAGKPHLKHSQSDAHVHVSDFGSIRQAFAAFDKDGSGTIDAEELFSCLKAMGHHPGPLELEELLAQMDTNGDGVIDFEEFAAVMTVRKGEEELEEELEQLRNLYVTLDENGDGRLSCDELHKAFKLMGIDLDTDELAYIFGQIDVNNDGDVTFEEFASYVWHFDEDDDEEKDEKERVHTAVNKRKEEEGNERKNVKEDLQLGK